ncbi:carboxylesterase/lipase family protein [Mycobacterium sp. MYCO198283]|uniref:carboxylesterase/lipase family protein n=1 Tax=Mycobacterium sp. MYCO198283 TaxID=2883505 RepID=UPI001E57C444|nr:carboxylesterase/lipase family protein [Mycobacterium sp. MYCO198283]MCG5433172.1 carboxylesterase/lipase family protein [Mycobacterium sp. MYCO198283]
MTSVQRESPVAETRFGPVRGRDDGRAVSFRGVRYAAAPAGELRWRAPEPPEPWGEVADATRFGPVCPQPVEPALPLELGAPQGEDCLTLNIYAPAGTQPGDGKPVMVWVHGGAYVIGSASQPLYDGRRLAAAGDVVVVTLNHRLGVFGFCDLSSLSTARHRFDANPGLHDVLAALRWVRDNIAAFGGAPDNVTLFGESAGAGVVTTLLAVPAAAGLFHRAIAQSSPATSVYDGRRARRIADLVLGELGIAAADAHRLREVPTAALVAATGAVFRRVPAQWPGILPFTPTVDGELVTDYPVQVARAGRTLPVPLLIGTNKHEAALFKWMKSPLMPITPEALRAMFAQIAAEQPDLRLPSEEQLGAAYRTRRRTLHGLEVARDIGFRMPTLWFADGHSAAAPVFLYRFDWSTPLLKLIGVGATHATELPYVWGNLTMGPKDPTFRLGGRAAGRAVSQRMQARWTAFARTGEPTGPPPRWETYRPGRRASLVIDRDDRSVDDLDADIRRTWGDAVLNFR